MNPHRLRTATVTAVATTLAAVGAAVGAAGAPAGAAPSITGSDAATARITPAGVGAVTLGSTNSALQAHHLVGKLIKGCELAGPGARSARLTAPLKGSVDFTLTAPRKVTDIVVTGGARARGVGVGARIPAIKAAFPKAKVDHSTDRMFGATFVTIPRNGGGRLQFAVSTHTHKVTQIGIPAIAVCE
jgi:hypothetical protein